MSFGLAHMLLRLRNAFVHFKNVERGICLYARNTKTNLLFLVRIPACYSPGDPLRADPGAVGLACGWYSELVTSPQGVTVLLSVRNNTVSHKIPGK